MRGILLFVLVLTACGGNNKSNNELLPLTSALSAEEFRGFNSVQQYQLNNKILAVLYKGMEPLNYFHFSPSSGFTTRAGAWSPDDIQRLLSIAAADFDAEQLVAQNRFMLNPDQTLRQNPLEIPLVYLFSMSLSRNYFDLWVAYQLANSILFSPAYELDSVALSDVQTVYSRLVEGLQRRKPIADMVYEHMISTQNWRRFRSPEDNTREMMEIYLRHFVDADVPRAAQACRNWYLTDADQNYQLTRGVNFNVTPQYLLGQTIVNCEDFYHALVGHRNFLPSVFRRVVDTFFVATDELTRDAIVAELMQRNVKDFSELYRILIFSRYFLLNENRLKSAEELVFNVGSKIHWQPHWRFFDYLTREDKNAGADRRNLSQLDQQAMVYKLGRPPLQELNLSSFSYLQGLVRYSLFKNVVADNDRLNMGWERSFVNAAALEGSSEAQFIDYVFLAVLGRRADEQEQLALPQLMRSPGVPMVAGAISREVQARVIFDYASRLPEFYYLGALR